MGKQETAPLEFKPLGDSAVRIGMGESISPELNRRIRSYAFCVEQARAREGFREGQERLYQRKKRYGSSHSSGASR